MLNTRHYAIDIPEEDYVDAQKKYLTGIEMGIGKIGGGFIPFYHYDRKDGCLYFSVYFFREPATEKPVEELVDEFEQRLEGTRLKWTRFDMCELLKKVRIPKD